LTEFGGSSGTNECFTVQVIKTSTTTGPRVNGTPITTTTFGSQVTDHAVIAALNSGGGAITGTVTFFVCNPTQTTGGACPTGGTQVSATTSLTDLGTTPPSASADSSSITANQTGTWCFRAVYAPGGANGANYTGSSDASSGECFNVTDSTAGSSLQNWLPNDTATVMSAHGAPLNGTLSAQLYASNNCAVGTEVPNQLYSKPLSGAASPASVTTNNTSFTVGTSQSVSWLVTFTSTDSNVASSTHCELTTLTITN
jgi:hypothetical protein